MSHDLTLRTPTPPGHAAAPAHDPAYAPTEKEKWGDLLPHPAHGPIQNLPRDIMGFVPPYYFHSPEEIAAQGLKPPAYAHPPRHEPAERQADAPSPRHDGFGPALQRAFITALAETGSVSAAAKAVGVSRQLAYRLRNAPHAAAFRAGWDEALARTVTLLTDTALARALDGVEEPVFWKGEEVGTRTRYNDRLLMFLLRNRSMFAPVAAPDPMRWHDVRPVHSIEGLADALDRIAPEAPEPSASPSKPPAHKPIAAPRLRSLV